MSDIKTDFETYTFAFQAHNSSTWNHFYVVGSEAAYQVACALNYTGFSFSIYTKDKRADITERFEIRMRNDSSLPVRRVASLNPIS